MAGTVRVELNKDGVRQLLRSPEVRADLERRGAAIADAATSNAGTAGGFATKTEYSDRVRVVVLTETFDAMQAEATDRALTRAVDAGRN